MNFYNIQSDIANKIISENAGITYLQFLEKEIETFLNSKKRKDIVDAYNYLIGNHDILSRKRGLWTSNDSFVESKRLPNNKIS